MQATVLLSASHPGASPPPLPKLHLFQVERFSRGLRGAWEGLQMKTSTVHRLMRTLVATGGLAYDADSRRYRRPRSVFHHTG